MGGAGPGKEVRTRKRCSSTKLQFTVEQCGAVWSSVAQCGAVWRVASNNSDRAAQGKAVQCSLDHILQNSLAQCGGLLGCIKLQGIRRWRRAGSEASNAWALGGTQ